MREHVTWLRLLDLCWVSKDTITSVRNDCLDLAKQSLSAASEQLNAKYRA